MIPDRSSDLDRLLAEVDRQNGEVSDLTASLSPEAMAWRPSPKKWSIAGHLAHMVMVNEPYLGALEERAARARTEGMLSDGPYKHPWFGKFFARSMAPPPKFRMKTLRSMIPDPATEGGDSLARFDAVQERLASTIEEIRGLDLGKARFSSPFMAIARLSLGTGIALLLLHNQRHIWLIREVLAAPDHPGSST